MVKKWDLNFVNVVCERPLVFYGRSIRGVVEPCCQAKLKGKKIVFQNKNTFNGYRQHIDMHCPASHSQSSIGFVLPSCCRAIGTRGSQGSIGTCLLVSISLGRIFFLCLLMHLNFTNIYLQFWSWNARKHFSKFCLAAVNTNLPNFAVYEAANACKMIYLFSFYSP